MEQNPITEASTAAHVSAQAQNGATQQEAVIRRDTQTLRVTREVAGSVTTVHIGVQKGNVDEYFQIRYDSTTDKSVVSAGADRYAQTVARSEIATQAQNPIAQAMVSAAERIFADGKLTDAELNGMLAVRSRGREALASESRMTPAEACALAEEISAVGHDANAAAAARKNAQTLCRSR